MRYVDVFVKILSEATGLSEDQLEKLTKVATSMFGQKKCYQTISEEEAEKLLTDLRKELPGIRMWLTQSNALGNLSSTFSQN